jgi:hypothetical protein
MKKLIILICLLFVSVMTQAQENTLLGTGAGLGGTKNTHVGYRAGGYEGSQDNAFTNSNSFFGYRAGIYFKEGIKNTFLGAESGGGYTMNTNSMSNSTFVGYRSGYSVRTGNGQNVFLGANAGYSLTTGVGNVFMGYNAGYSETGSNKLYIDNSNTATPLVYGDFNANQVGINVLPGAYTLNVGGSVNASGLFINGIALSSSVTTVGPWTFDGTAVNYNNGNIGIGIISNIPAYKLDINGQVNATSLFLNGTPLAIEPWTTSGGILTHAGNVGIGTAATGTFKLAVEGKIGAREIQITKASAWPDYVFEAGHKLPSIEEVDRFIKANKHLPDVPSAADIRKDGHQLGEMDLIFLRKIEEMTLYLIDHNERLKKIESKIELVNKQNKN